MRRRAGEAVIVDSSLGFGERCFQIVEQHDVGQHSRPANVNDSVGPDVDFRWPGNENSKLVHTLTPHGSEARLVNKHLDSLTERKRAAPLAPGEAA